MFPPQAERAKAQAPPICSFRVDDFDALTGVSDVWDERYTQIGRGRASVRVALAGTSRLQLGYAARSPGVRIRGATIPGRMVLAVAVECSLLHLNRAPWPADRIGFVRSGQEYEVMTAAPHRVIALSVDEDRLQAEALARWGQPFPTGSTGPLLRLRGAEARGRLLHTWIRWIAAANRHPEFLADPRSAARAEEAILGAVLDAVELPLETPASGPRRRLAYRAESFIRGNVQEPMDLATMCQELRTSTRSLHASFRAVFGIPPKAYQKALRLDCVRRALLQPSPETTVSGVAARWGFFQFGYFAMDYRRMFGETPRETLRAARAGRCAPPPWAERSRAA